MRTRSQSRANPNPCYAVWMKARTQAKSAQSEFGSIKVRGSEVTKVGWGMVGGEQGEAGYRMLKSPLSTGNQTTELASHCRTQMFVLGGRESPLRRLSDRWAGWAACLKQTAPRNA